MPLQVILPWLLIGVLMSIVTMVFGVSRDDIFLAMISSAGFSVFILIIGFVTNRYYWKRATEFSKSGEVTSPETLWRANASADIARRNAKLFATCYAWGGIALLAVYSLTQLNWKHGEQYATILLVLSAISLIFAGLLTGEPSKLRAAYLRIAAMLTTVQAALSAVGLAYLVGVGKLTSTRADWAANYIFLFGGIAILLLSLMALRSNKALNPR